MPLRGRRVHERTSGSLPRRRGEREPLHPDRRTGPEERGVNETPVLDVQDLSVQFRLSRGLFRRKRVVRAVSDVSLTVAPGETLGLVGESGSGKSTLGRAILRLVPITSGRVVVHGRDVGGLRARALRRAREQMQMVFQDPYSSLDPSMTIGANIAEPLEVFQGLRGRERDQRVVELLELVNLSPYHIHRYPYEFSGGQRQRIAIARAIAVRPALVVCDEPVSALDVSTQNQIINLLEDLRAELGLSYLFIAHDLAVVRHISHRTAVMYLGRIVELGPSDRVYEDPAHPYTQALISAVPIPDPVKARQGNRIILRGGLPDPGNAPSGCPFNTRCPFAMEICRTRMPGMTPLDRGGEVACHLQTSGPTLAGRT
ncbi:MAG: ABC transporter ATP-binding protein, partial [Microbacteriaceae bacterium]|nr:ABC transporter ATP-binding protein [Microbacteriaceae bacterium]